MDKKNIRKNKVLDENINENDIIKVLDDTKKHIPTRIRRVASGILKIKLNEQEKWEKESNAANIHIEHLQEEIKEKDNEIQQLKEIIKDLENKNNEYIIKQENFKNDIAELLKIVNKINLSI
jgi:chromosome segregation ATPase